MFRKNASFKLLLVCLVSFSSCQNVFNNLGSHTSDEAIYEDALKAMDAQDYASAVADFNKLSGGFAAHTTILENWAGALAGKCGLNFINYMNALAAANLGATTFFTFLMKAWGNTVIDPASCSAAEGKIKAIWAMDSPSGSQQLFMAILSLVKIGTYVRSKADNTENAGLGNGTIDVAYDSCNAAAAPATHNLTDAEVAEVVTGFALFLTNIVNFSASLSGSLSAVVSGFTGAGGICSFLPANTCTTTNASSVTAPMILNMRRLLKTDTVGLEACPVATLATCC